MPLDAATEKRIRELAARRGVDPDRAVARAQASAGTRTEAGDDKPSGPVADRLLVGFLPFIKVRELRSKWLGLTDRVPDDEMMCGDFQVKHGGAPAADEPPA